MFLILGAGVGGLTLAVRLAQLGKSFLLIEQHEAAADLGAGLLLAPNVTPILQGLGVWDDLLLRGRLTTRWSILDQSGATLRELSMPVDGPAALSIHRADLLAVLRSCLPPNVLRTGVAVSGIATSLDTVILSLADGTHAIGNALIGCDGIRSAVRKHLFGDRPLHYRGYVGWRGIAPFVPRNYPDAMLSESWGQGGRFGIAPLDACRTYWYASANRPEAWVDENTTRKASLLTQFAGWHDPVADLIAATPHHQILVSRIYDAPKLAEWSRGNITLLGDAAHAMTPNLGQGACLAIEDAWALGSAIGRCPNAESAFSEYQTCRRSRASSLQIQSRVMGWVVQLESQPVLQVRNWVTRKVPESLIRLGMKNIFAGSVQQ